MFVYIPKRLVYYGWCYENGSSTVHSFNQLYLHLSILQYTGSWGNRLQETHGISMIYILPFSFRDCLACGCMSYKKQDCVSFWTVRGMGGGLCNVLFRLIFFLFFGGGVGAAACDGHDSTCPHSKAKKVNRHFSQVILWMIFTKTIFTWPKKSE